MGLVWKTIELALADKKLEKNQWEVVLPEALHSLRTLLCTATNKTPHERFLSFPRRSATGHSLPSWLTDNQKVLMKRHARRSKFEPYCDEVDLVSVNPTHAQVKLPCGREMTVSLRDLAPLPQKGIDPPEVATPIDNVPFKPRKPLIDNTPSKPHKTEIQPPSGPTISDLQPTTSSPTSNSDTFSTSVTPEHRISARVTKGIPPERFVPG